MAKDNKKKLSAEDLEQASGGRIEKVQVTYSADDPHLQELFGNEGHANGYSGGDSFGGYSGGDSFGGYSG